MYLGHLFKISPFAHPNFLNVVLDKACDPMLLISRPPHGSFMGIRAGGPHGQLYDLWYQHPPAAFVGWVFRHTRWSNANGDWEHKTAEERRAISFNQLELPADFLNTIRLPSIKRLYQHLKLIMLHKT
jgi:hypothetical protein